MDLHFLIHLLLYFTIAAPSFQTSEDKLLSKLTNEYSGLARPVKNNLKSVMVEFGIELVHIISITESTQTLDVKVWLRMSWTNELMKWKPSKWGNISKTRLHAHSVWTPDIYVHEDVSSDMSSGPERYKTMVQLHADGTHTWNVPALLHSSCKFDVTNFPFDTQTCYITFISWTHVQSEMDVNISSKPIVVSKNYVNSSEWTLISATGKKELKKYNCCPSPFVNIIYTIKIHRKPLYYFYYVVIPCLIQMLIVLFTFFLPPDSGERIGVTITVLLVFAVYLEVLNNSLPKSSASTPALSKFYLAAMAESAFSIIATCFVLVIHFKGAEKGIGPMPEWARNIFIKRLARILFVRQLLREHGNDELLALEKKGHYTEIDVKENVHGVLQDNQMLLRSCSHVDDPSIKKLVEEVRIITGLIHDQNLQDEIEEEWQLLGKVFDRLFFLLFLVVFLVSSLTILIPVYHAHNIIHKDMNL